MNSFAVRHPSQNNLFLDYVGEFEKLQDFFAVDYRNQEALTSAAHEVSSRKYPRQAIAAILDRQNRSWDAGPESLQQVEELAKPESIAVVTGQQVGIFGGPLFTMYKALTCIKLANRLARQTGANVVPVFWLAADDDDIAEVNQLTVQTRDNSLSPFSCVFDTDDRKPVADVHLTDNILNCHEAFARIIFDSEFKEEILSSLAKFYTVGETLPGAFARWLHHLFGKWGLVIINPSDPEVRKLSADLFEREFAENSPSTKAVLAASGKLEEKGYPVQVSLRSGRFNIFYTSEFRYTLEAKNGSIAATDGTFEFETRELVASVKEEPQKFSPNVILRPVVQDFLLPTVAYVAGPAEISYFAQLKGVYEAFGVNMPAIYPRKSVTMLEKKIQKVLTKYRLEVADFWGNPDELLSRVARQEAPEGLFDPVADARDSLGGRLDDLKQKATDLDPSLSKFIDKERNKIFHQLEVIEKKLVQAAKRQNDILQQQLTKAVNSLYPNHTLQERELSYIPYLCKYSIEFIDELYEAMEIDRFDHQIIEL